MFEQLAFCPNCGKEVSPQAVACPNCGHPLNPAQTVPPISKQGGTTSARNFAYYSIICAVVSLVIFPLPLLILGIVFGAIAISRGEVGLGAVGLVLSIIFGIVGILMGIAAFAGV